jgi:DNA-binding MarR family transcriptional regulator
MPTAVSPARETARPPTRIEGERLRRFLHYGHVFSSAVQEILETRYIGAVSPYPLTVAQFHLLKLVALRGEHQVGQVAEFLGVSSPAVSKNIDKLEGQGLLIRCTSHDDRRVTLLSATPEGRALVSRYESLKADRLAPVLAGFASDEIEQLTGLLERFSVRLYRAEESSSAFCLRCAAYGDAECALVAVDGGCPYQRGRDATRPGPASGEVADRR